MEILTAQNLVLVATFILGYFVYWLAYGRLRRSKGFVGPPVQAFYGNYEDFRRHSFQLHLLVDEYYKKYGKLFSFFHYNNEVKVVSDPKMINEITIKKFGNFSKRQLFQELPWPCHQMITLHHGPKWKYMRTLLVAVTGPSKLKEFLGHLANAATTYMKKLEQVSENGKKIEAFSLSKGYVMEILLAVTFSFDHPNQSEFNNVMIKLVEKFMHPPSWVHDVGALPFGDNLLKYLPSAYKNNLQPLIDTALQIVAGRKNDEEKKEDLLQILLNIQKAGPSSDGKELTDEDILGAGLILLTAVHSLTSVALTTTVYYIAKYPDVQTKIQKEIDTCSTEEGFPSWDHLKKSFSYLDNVFEECKRLHPPSFALARECTESCTIDDIVFEKGDKILIPSYSIHRDDNIWKNATSFNPERFDSPRDDSTPTLYSHGLGRRMCLGTLFSCLEMKLVLVLLLQKYNISLNKESPKELTYKTSTSVQLTSIFEHPIFINVEKRETYA